MLVEDVHATEDDGAGPEGARAAHRPAGRPLISVVIPCYNYEHYVGEAIESVLAQKADDVEIIVIDDGSTDRSWERIAKYDGMIIARRIKNCGSVRASMTGFELSRGEYIYFLDADDALCPGAIDEVRRRLRPSVTKVQFALTPIDGSGNCIGDPFPRLDPRIDSAALVESIKLRGHYLTPPTSGNIFRRDVYENLGEMPYERGIDGVALWLAPFVGDVISIEQPLGKYRIHGANASQFATLSAARMREYESRFSGRLGHLQVLLEQRGMAGRFEAREDYGYVLETRVIGDVAEGRRPTRDVLRRYAQAMAREYTGPKRLLMQGFALAMAIAPLKLAVKLAELRVNPAKSTWLRRRLKSVARSSQSVS